MQPLKVRRGLPREAFNKALEFNRLHVTIGRDYTILGAADWSWFPISTMLTLQQSGMRPSPWPYTTRPLPKSYFHSVLNDIHSTIVDSQQPQSRLGLWSQLSQIMRTCQHVDIDLNEDLKKNPPCVDTFEEEESEEFSMHMKTFVDLILRPNINLKSVWLRLNIPPTDGYTPVEARYAVRDFEHRLLNALVGFRGLNRIGRHAVQLDGFRYAKPMHIELVKKIITLPRPQSDGSEALSKMDTPYYECAQTDKFGRLVLTLRHGHRILEQARETARQ